MRVIDGGRSARNRLRTAPLKPPGVRTRADGDVIVQDVDVEASFNAAMQRLQVYVRVLARVMSYGDRMLADDLEQEAWIKLWELDPLRMDEDDQPYVRKALLNAMRKVMRKEMHLPPDTLEIHVRTA
jgi:DNA-directed RNA polymerase specialized sigma24 family protein